MCEEFLKSGSNQIGVSTGGTKRFTVGSFGIELRNGAQFEFRKNDNIKRNTCLDLEVYHSTLYFR